MLLSLILAGALLLPTQPVSGNASWYCLPHVSRCTSGYSAYGMYAAAGPSLRHGAWRGRYVSVWNGTHHIRVRLIDVCGCPNGRVIDLYANAFRKLAPLSRGVIHVRVTT